MATIKGTVSGAQSASPVINWQFAESSDIAEPLVNWNQYPDKTVHVTNGVADIEGSNDAENWVTLTDIHGTSLAGVGSETIHVILENPLYIRPVPKESGTTVVITGAR